MKGRGSERVKKARERKGDGAKKGDGSTGSTRAHQPAHQQAHHEWSGGVFWVQCTSCACPTDFDKSLKSNTLSVRRVQSLRGSKVQCTACVQNGDGARKGEKKRGSEKFALGSGLWALGSAFRIILWQRRKIKNPKSTV